MQYLLKNTCEGGKIIRGHLFRDPPHPHFIRVAVELCDEGESA